MTPGPSVRYPRGANQLGAMIMDETTEGFLLIGTAATIGTIRVLEEKGIFSPEDSQRLYDHASLWLSELPPDMMSTAARQYALEVLEGMAQGLSPGHRPSPE